MYVNPHCNKSGLKNQHQKHGKGYPTDYYLFSLRNYR